jgi:hypothetical protein
MRKLIAGAALALIVSGIGGTAFAGEVTGSGKGGPNGGGVPGATQGRAKSICAFSGLADGGEGEPAGPGAPPQNWGQIPKAVRDVLATEGEHPGDACNGHTGFLAGG